MNQSRIKELDHAEILQHFSQWLDQVQTEVSFAFGLYYPNQPIALLLAQQKENKQVKISFLYVNPQFRRLGLGTQVLVSLEKKLISLGLKSPVIVYQEQLWPPNHHARLDPLFAKMAYQLPERIQLFIKSRISDDLLQTKPELRVHQYLPRSFSFIPLDGSPTSYAIEHKNERVAEILSHPYLGNTLHYDSFFVKEKFRGTVIPCCLAAKALSMHHKHRDEFPYSSTGIKRENEAHTQYMNHYFMHHACLVLEEKSVSKT